LVTFTKFQVIIIWRQRSWPRQW